jgi:hypothetical protein
MNLDEKEMYLILDALECKLYDNNEIIRELKKYENPDSFTIDIYAEEIAEIKNIIKKFKDN